MVKTMKRGLSLMFVLSILVSMLAIPAEAKASGKFTGNSSCKITKDAEITSYITGFSGYDITSVDITDGGKGAPSISGFDVNSGGSWSAAGDLNSLSIAFYGGQKGTYTYKVRLWSGSKKLATKTIKVVNSSSW